MFRGNSAKCKIAWIIFFILNVEIFQLKHFHRSYLLPPLKVTMSNNFFNNYNVIKLTSSVIILNESLNLYSWSSQFHFIMDIGLIYTSKIRSLIKWFLSAGKIFQNTIMYIYILIFTTFSSFNCSIVSFVGINFSVYLIVCFVFNS